MTVGAVPQPATVPFAELVNKDFITPGFGPNERVCPYWGMVWPSSDGGPVLAWRSRESERALRDAGIRISSRPGGRRHRRTQDEALALLNRRRSRLITLGTVNLWRATTSQQIVALTGQPGLNSSRSDETELLFDAGLIQRGRFTYAGRSLDSMPEIFRPNPSADTVDLRQHLRFADWVGTLVGQSISGHQYDRHNLLATEISLRAAEICPLRSVLGETLATWSRLFPSRLQPNPHRSADAVWIRSDGLKIAVELTATVTVATIKKIDQLADLLARDTAKSTVVLFVVAPRPGQDHELDVGRRLRQAIRKSARSSRTRVLAEVSDRLIIATWKSWFPATGLVSREFVRLRAQRYSSTDDEWVDADLLDPFDVPFDGAGSLEVAQTDTNLNSVLGAPWWVRTEPGFDFDNFLIKRAGFDRVLAIQKVAR